MAYEFSPFTSKLDRAELVSGPELVALANDLVQQAGAGFLFDTLAQLLASAEATAAPNGQPAQVLADGDNTGFYVKEAGVWTLKSTATIPGLDSYAREIEHGPVSGASGAVIDSSDGQAVYDMAPAERAAVFGAGTDLQGWIDTITKTIAYEHLRAVTSVQAPKIVAGRVETEEQGLVLDSSNGQMTVDVEPSDRAVVFASGAEVHGYVDAVNRTLHWTRITTDEAASLHSVDVPGGSALGAPKDAVLDYGGTYTIIDSATGHLVETYDPSTGTKTVYYNLRQEPPRPISVRTEIGPTLVRDHLSNPEYQVAGRLHVGVATLARTGGRYWAAWWCHNHLASEASGNYIAVAYSDDDRVTWTELGALAYPSAAIEYKIIDPMFWVDPASGELWLIVNVSHKQDNDGVTMYGDALSDGIQGGWALICGNPTALPAQTVWSAPFRLGYIGDPRRPVRIAGQWWLPIDMWRALATSPPIYPDRAGCWLHRFYPDQRRVEPIVRLPPNAASSSYSGFFETELLELRDGRLMATIRTGTGTDRSFSSDSGRTWTPWAAWSAAISANSSSSRIWLGRAASGRMMLVYNSDPLRQILVVALSDDDGETFPHQVVANPGYLGASYPIAVVNGDLISVIWDHGRTSTRQIIVSDVSEAAIVAGTAVPTLHIVSQP